MRCRARNGVFLPGGGSAFLLCTLPLELLLLLLFSSAAPTNAEFHCQVGEWWNGTCVSCTKCTNVVLRTCQPHKDTICGTFDDIKIDLFQVAVFNIGSSIEFIKLLTGYLRPFCR